MENLFILGAIDPEMNRIEAILREQGASIVHVAVGGRRVHPGNAYVADPVEVPTGATPVWVECRSAGWTPAGGGVVIDHHREGDLGFSMPASEYWRASSIGQLYALMGLGEPSPDDLALAAMDHAFAGAVRGECPGVTPEAVLAVKYREIATGTRSTEAEVMGSVAHFGGLIEAAPAVTIGTQSLRDLRGEYLGEGYSLALLTAQVATTVAGEGVILRHRDFAAGAEKWSLSGEILPKTVIQFQQVWAPAQGLEKIYGVPARGYAGGYVKA